MQRQGCGSRYILCLALSALVVLMQSHATEGSFYIDWNDTNFTEADLQELDALYPIARYAGMGYNILRGNPEGDFVQGGRDPGIHDTRWIFNLTYMSNKEGRYGEKTVAVPDQVEFHPTKSCASRSRTKAYSGQSSYQGELQRNIGGGLTGGFSKLIELGFSLSSGMSEVEKKTKDSREVIVQETRICNYGSVRYKDELVFGGSNPYVLSEGFKNDVKKLPRTLNTNAYRKFIENWGTHVILLAEVGTRFIERQSASYSEVYSFLSKQKSKGGSLKVGGGANGGGATGDFSIDLKTLNKNVNGRTKIGHSKTTLTIGSEEIPAPIKLELMPIAEALSELMWGPTWREDGIAERQQSLVQALLRYPIMTGAHVNKDPAITIKPRLTWLSGTFALPMPAIGCPEGFSRGCIRQDTYNSFHYNSWSYGIQNRLRCDVRKNNITTCFCVKKEESADFNEIPWPRGSYCIARKNDNCPSVFEFEEGYIKWDDKDLFNKNAKKGALPDGNFDKNTKIFFCCRNDAPSASAMVMPTRDRFVLYRYGGRCQKVSGMEVQEDYIEWVNELVNNKDEVSGVAPDDHGQKRRHKLFYCHYTV